MKLLHLLICAIIVAFGTGSVLARDILVGGVAPKTGEAATFGVSTENGVRLAVEQANAAGGLLDGRQIRLVFEDDKGDPVAGKLAFSRLIERDQVCAVVGSVMSKVSIAGADVAERSRTPMISSASTNPTVTLGKKYVFRACFIDPFQGRVMAKFARENLKAKRAAILYDASNDYNKGLAEVFRDVFKELGGEIVAIESYPARSVDFRPQLTKVLQAAPDALFMPNYYNDVALQAKQAREIGIKAALLGGDGWDSPDLVKAAGAAIEGGCFSNHFTRESDNPKVKDFVLAYEKRYGGAPDALASLGYEAAQILLAAIKKAGSDSPDKIRDAMEKSDVETITGRIAFDKEHNPLKPAAILKIVDGQQKFQTWVAP
jgi:branched-chain amino acid transport system substrate-binding protein